MKTKGILAFLLLLLICTVLICCTQPSLEVEVADYVEDLVSEDKFSGVVLIAKDGEAIFKQAYGPANRSFDVPNRIDTKFNLGSMNKMFTAVAILQLVEKGELSLDDYIRTHLPDYPNQEVANRVKIHHLLTHTSGMGHYWTEEFFQTSKDQLRAVEDYLPFFVDAPLQFEPGSQFSYSNAGYMVLGLIIEAVTGQSYFDYVMANVYEPCQMVNTDAYELDYVVPNLAVGYTREGIRDGPWKNNLFTHVVKGGPAGGGYSTAEDLLNFSNALLNHELLTPEGTELLLEGKVVAWSTDAAYAYGFVDRTIRDHRLVGHGGGAPGICANLDIYLDLGYTVVVLSNTDQGCLLVNEFIQERLLR